MTTLEEMMPNNVIQVFPPLCTTCGMQMMLDEDLGNGIQLFSCPICDFPPPEGPGMFCISTKNNFRVYKNHCWNCGGGIDSRFAVRSKTPGMGYHCPRCGEDLTKRKGGEIIAR